MGSYSFDIRNRAKWDLPFSSLAFFRFTLLMEMRMQYGFLRGLSFWRWINWNYILLGNSCILRACVITFLPFLFPTCLYLIYNASSALYAAAAVVNNRNNKRHSNKKKTSKPNTRPHDRFWEGKGRELIFIGVWQWRMKGERKPEMEMWGGGKFLSSVFYHCSSECCANRPFRISFTQKFEILDSPFHILTVFVNSKQKLLIFTLYFKIQKFRNMKMGKIRWLKISKL